MNRRLSFVADMMTARSAEFRRRALPRGIAYAERHKSSDCFFRFIRGSQVWNRRMLFVDQ